MKPSLTLPAILFISLSPLAWSGENLDFENPTTRINYSLGYQIGGDFKRQQVEMDAEAVVQGIRDALDGKEPQMSAKEMRNTLMDLKRKVEADQQAEKKRREDELTAAGTAFLEENAKQDGVITTPSGLQYRVLKEGTGATPKPSDKVSVNYRGKKIDGTEFDSSFKRGKPATFQANRVIPGWAEGLQLMKEGGKIELFIPPKLAYKRRGPLAYQTLIFEVELLKVGEPETEAEAKTAD
ncbi:MAG: FKBP-type peptidyl-prolyl cis-trans isomerase [Gammaproteobacteria bacterium]|nr:FKBP-type peptidyl-prolyl cis-trans isomerase [Gammaproteobacteria bacterium]